MERAMEVTTNGRGGDAGKVVGETLSLWIHCSLLSSRLVTLLKQIPLMSYSLSSTQLNKYVYGRAVSEKFQACINDFDGPV